jgi:hypothetical protein
MAWTNNFVVSPGTNSSELMTRPLGWMLVGVLIWAMPTISAVPHLTRMDSLFIIAATGEPRFKTARDSCEKLLVGDAIVPDYLIASRLSGLTPRQHHYVEHLFITLSDSGRHALARQKLASALSTISDSLKAQLLHIGSELADSTFLNVARLYLGADSEDVRKAAVRSLGMYPNPQDDSGLLQRIETTTGLERQENLWALSRHKGVKDWQRLVPVLKDEMLYNRQLARKLLDSASGGKWSALVKYRPTKMDQVERLEWMLLALDNRDSTAQAYLKKERLVLSPLARKFMDSEFQISTSKF